MSSTMTAINPRPVAVFSQQATEVGDLWHTTQQKAMECLPCCVSIVLRQIGHPFARGIQLDQIRTQMGYRPDVSDVVGAKPVGGAALLGALAQAADARANQTGLGVARFHAGTYMKAAYDALVSHYPFSPGDPRKWFHDAAYGGSAAILKKALRHCSAAYPAIVGVRWLSPPFGQHAIVCFGARAAKEYSGDKQAGRRAYIFSDPASGIHYSFLRPNGADIVYQAANGAQGKLLTETIYLWQ